MNELVRAVDRVRPDRVAEVTMAAYDAALDLVKKKRKKGSKKREMNGA